MIYIVLRNGKVLQYNAAERCAVEGATIALHTKGGTGLVARIPLDIVERAEWSKPCRILREPKDIRKKRLYR